MGGWSPADLAPGGRMMALNGPEIAHVLIAVGLLLLAAHGVGHLFTLVRQPRVIGEIVGGLLLGPTVLGALAPDVQARIFPPEGPTAVVLGWTYQLGLFLLMFCSGAEMRTVFRRGDGRVVGFVTVTGLVCPFVAGAVLFRFVDSAPLLGAAQSRPALLLVFSLAIAVTSIPVISRIMFDLGIIETSFARIVLGVAVIEDVVVYVVLALALGMVTSSTEEKFGLPGRVIVGLPDAAVGSADPSVAREIQRAPRTRFAATCARATSWTPFVSPGSRLLARVSYAT